jgi:hypothetical protein
MSNVTYIDAARSRQGTIVPSDGRTVGYADGLFVRAKSAARRAVSAHLDGAYAEQVSDRFDSAVDKLNGDFFANDVDFRSDAAGAQGGALLAGALRQVIKPTLEDTNRAIPNGLRLFGVDSTLALGTKTFSVSREYAAGTARVWGGSESGLGTNTFSTDEQEFQVRNYVTSVIYDVFEEMNASFANMNLAAKLVRIARDTLELFANEMIWFGDSRYRIHGVLNYPWLDKELSDLVFAGVPTDTRTYLSALNGWVNKQHHASKGVMGPKNMATSARIADWILQTPMGTATTMRDRTLGEAFLAGQTGRLEGQIERCWELEDIMGEGYDGILFYRNDDRGIQNMIPGGGIQALPLFMDDLKRRQIFWMAHGGVVMLEAGNMLLVIVKATEA